MTAIGTPLLSHEFGWDRPPDQDGNTADASDPGGEAYERTAYQYGETDQAEDSASVSSHASSSADSVPLDNSAEEYIDWLSNGCPDSDTEYSLDSE